MVKITPEWLARSGTEDGEQTALFCHINQLAKADYRYGLIYAIPNGGKRGVANAARLAATGTRRGFPDVGVPVPFKARLGTHDAILCPGMFLELKRRGTENQKPGRLAEAQAYWRDALRSQGYYVQTGYGWEHGAELIAEYFNGNFR